MKQCIVRLVREKREKRGVGFTGSKWLERERCRVGSVEEEGKSSGVFIFPSFILVKD